MKYTIAFDISEDRKRTRAVKVLLEKGYRVQKSVFEAFLSKESLEQLRARLEETIDPDTDSVRFYPLCKDCEAKVTIVGTGTTVEQTRYLII